MIDKCYFYLNVFSFKFNNCYINMTKKYVQRLYETSPNFLLIFFTTVTSTVFNNQVQFL